jgi:hypothetical protein
MTILTGYTQTLISCILRLTYLKRSDYKNEAICIRDNDFIASLLKDYDVWAYKLGLCQSST